MPRSSPRPRTPLGPSLPRVPFALALRRRPALRRALVGAAALLVGLLVQRAVAGAEAVRAAWGPTRPVVVATHDLLPGRPVGPDDVRIERRPVAMLPAGALGALPEGRAVRSLVLDGEVLLRGRLVATGAEGIAALLPAGTRAVAVPTEPSTAPPLRVGQRVDLVAVGQDGTGRIDSTVLALAAPVVHVGEHAATVALGPDAIGPVAAALAAGAVTLAIVP